MSRQARIVAAIAVASAVAVVWVATLTPASASVTTQLRTAQDNRANCQALAAHATGTQLERARDCVADQNAIIALLTATATPTATPATSPAGTPTAPPTTATPTATPTTPPVTTPPATPPPSVAVCPAWPATPDAACTGYKHTGVTLHTCASRITTPGTYDSCRFAGGLVIAAPGVTVKRSLVDGGHVEGGPGSVYDLKGAILEDVQILGPGNDGMAAIGNSNYTCRRCDISNNNRGFAVANKVLIVDSYAHDFWIQPKSQQATASAHQTAISTHGGTGVQVLHSTLACKSDRYACSAGFSFYSEDAPGISDVVVQHCLITTDAGYGMLFGTMIAGKPYGITDTRVTDNVIASQEYGPVGNWPSGQAGNVWSGNHSPAGAVINPDR